MPRLRLAVQVLISGRYAEVSLSLQVQLTD